MALALEEEADEQTWSRIWDYQYSYPDDCMRVIGILTDLGDAESTPIPFDLATNDDGTTVIHTNEADAIVRYTSLVTDATRFSPAFASALGWKLAEEIAGPLSAAPGLQNRALQRFMMAIKDGESQAANEVQTPKRDDGDSEFLRARRG